MTRRAVLLTVTAIVVVGAAGFTGYVIGFHQNPPVPSTAVLVANPPIAKGTPDAGTSVSKKKQRLPITVEPSSPSGPNASILQPTSCILQGSTVSAKGTYQGGFAPENYVRFGAVVELYAFSGPVEGYPHGLQLAELNGGETPDAIYQTNRTWHVESQVDISSGHVVRCVVAVQQTHDFETAGNIGG